MAATSRTPTCGRFLAEARRRHGISQQELARRSGIEQPNISRIERDKSSPTVHTLNRLLEAMGETLRIDSVSLDQPPPGGGNVSIRELRADFDRLTPDEQLEQGVILARVASELAQDR